ncbi:MAG: formylglycine-generating enzyme family protein [Planctomycetes bacterium]|nr:formylglycine-generating enzyme family protein [Planctomycetota bacterium]
MIKTIGIATILFGGAWLALDAASPSTPPAATQPSTQPAKELILDLGNKVTMKLVLIPAGKFKMGSLEDEKGRIKDEGPQREVAISNPFYLGIYEVTQEQYEQVMGKNPSQFKAPANPVDSVPWADAVEFCKELSQKAGKTVMLPTEARWEYACRAGSKTRFCYGDDENKLDDYAWYDKNSGNKTHPVGQKKANDWGLYDMHGNVWEWCSDWYADSYENVKNEDPQGPDSGTRRILRGGGWSGTVYFCRSATRRGWSLPSSRSSYFGFRVVVELK